MNSLSDWAAQRRAELDRLFEARLAPPAEGDPGRLLEAMRYSLLAPGKRIRPLLALAAAEAVGAVDDDVRLACAAVELVHCYSLIHDDLPAMDDDDFRRGRPSNHKAFGEATAILAGDALLTLAFDWIGEAGERAGRPGSFLAASRALARAAGAFGMVRGQARDLGEAPPATLAALETLHAEKTAALFRAALEVGGSAAGAAPDQLADLARFGTAYGIAFQHADDAADREHAGHAAAAAARRETLLTDACAAVAPLGARAERLIALARALSAGAAASSAQV
ncbi:MAG TPA: polyprenyl synthetase family protein [Polyangia bacterium]|nr:polyprenyl synthetase family protein [Polyangia bacterium]